MDKVRTRESAKKCYTACARVSDAKDDDQPFSFAVSSTLGLVHHDSKFEVISEVDVTVFLWISFTNLRNIPSKKSHCFIFDSAAAHDGAKKLAEDFNFDVYVNFTSSYSPEPNAVKF